MYESSKIYFFRTSLLLFWYFKILSYRTQIFKKNNIYQTDLYGMEYTLRPRFPIIHTKMLQVHSMQCLSLIHICFNIFHFESAQTTVLKINNQKKNFRTIILCKIYFWFLRNKFSWSSRYYMLLNDFKFIKSTWYGIVWLSIIK